MNWIRSVVTRLPIETDFQDLAPWDSLRADLEISKFLRVASEYGPTLHIKRVVADYRFDDDAPYAIVLEPAESYFACTIVLNPTYKVYFAGWKRGQRLLRLAWLLSAFFATLDGYYDYSAKRPPFLGFELSPSPHLTIDTIVIAARSRYLIHKRVNRVLSEQFATTLNELLHRSFGRSAMDAAILVLDRAGVHIPRLIDSRTAPGTQAEANTWMACSLAIWSMFSTLASLSAQIDETDEWQPALDALSSHPVFAAWLAPVWQTLHSDWRTAPGRDLGENRTVQPVLADAVRQTYESIGIRVRRTDEPGPTLEFLPLAKGEVA